MVDAIDIVLVFLCFLLAVTYLVGMVFTVYLCKSHSIRRVGDNSEVAPVEMGVVVISPDPQDHPMWGKHLPDIISE